MTEQTSLQILAIAIPTVTVLIGILVNNHRMSDLRSEMNARFTEVNHRFDEVNRRIDDTRDLLRAEMQRMEGVLDARLKHLEEREDRF